MADANLAVDVQIKNGKKAEAELNAIGNAGDKAGKKLDLMGKVINNADKIIKFINIGMNKLETQLNDGSLNANTFTRNVDRLTNSLSRLSKMAQGSYNSLGEVSNELNKIAKNSRDMAAQSNRFNVGNIAAQFQDIAVTSAMKMNPLTIGLQQGTQLAYVLGQSKAPLADFLAGIKNLISPVTLLSVGLTALIAKGIQLTDWVSVGKSTLNGLANVFDWCAENVDKLTKYLIVFLALGVINFTNSFANALAAMGKSLITATVNVVKFTAAWLVGNPLGAIVLGIVAVSDALLELGVITKDTFNKFIGYTLVAGYAVGGLFDLVANIPFKGFDKAVEDYKNTLSDIVNEDYIGDLDAGVKKLSSTASNALRSMTEGLGENIKDAKELEKTINKITKSYDKLFEKQSEKIEDKKFQDSIEGLDTYEKTYRTVVHNMTKDVENLKKEAIAAGVPLAKINEIFKNSKSKIESAAQAEADYAYQTELTKQSTEEYNAVIDYGASLTKGFFSDLKSGLKEGESAWQAFTNSVVKMLDKISDKIMDLAIDAMFDSMKSSGGNKNNWLSSLLNIGTQAAMASVGSTGTTTYAPGVTSTGGISKSGGFTYTAKGGTFTNGVYNSPTMFAFANGGRFGVMGEAGPEAVMPLTRRSDGSLGVKADGIGGGSPVVVNVINNSNARATTQQRQTEQGTTIDVMIDELVAQKLGQTGTASNQALTAFNNRQLIVR